MHCVVQHFFSPVLIDAEWLKEGQADRYCDLNCETVMAAPKEVTLEDL